MDELMSRPIFVHASPRSGSTYFFAVLRRMPALLSFNESIIDVFSYYGKNIKQFKATQKWNVNHQFLDRDDFAEFVEAWDSVMHLYPPFPSFSQYLPDSGILPEALRVYLGALIEYARGRSRRAALCEIHSRGRAGALRDAFGGFHIAQFRDPLSQFGSFFRPVEEGGRWNYLVFPLMEMGLSGEHPLYRLVPEAWRVPVLPWPADDRGQRWASSTEYVSLVASNEPGAIQRTFRWHLFSWFLSNLAAISYSDCILNIDDLHDAPRYRDSIGNVLQSEIGVAPDFGDLENYRRYYDFDDLDVASVCHEVQASLAVGLDDGRLDAAVRMLGKAVPVTPVQTGAAVLLDAMAQSLQRFAESPNRRHVRSKDWQSLVKRYRPVCSDPVLRTIVRRLYPVGAPVVRTARKWGLVG